MYYTNVKNGAVEGKPFVTEANVTTADGTLVMNAHKMSDEELIELGVYPIVHSRHAEFDTRIHELGDPIVTVEVDHVKSVDILISIPVEILKGRIVDKVYELSEKLLTEQTIGRSYVEIARWPNLRSDVAEYGNSSSVGKAMQAAIDTSTYDAVQIAAYVNNKGSYEDLIFVTRLEHIKAIGLITTHQEILDYEVNVIVGNKNQDGSVVNDSDPLAWPEKI